MEGRRYHGGWGLCQIPKYTGAEGEDSSDIQTLQADTRMGRCASIALQVMNVAVVFTLRMAIPFPSHDHPTLHTSLLRDKNASAPPLPSPQSSRGGGAVAPFIIKSVPRHCHNTIHTHPCS